MNQKAPGQLGSIGAAAERLQCSKSSVRRLIDQGDLAGYRVGTKMLRVDLDEVERLLQPIPTAAAS